jgi:predicted regulator of Ras-like GTPase activity (Roadblock/LC7/MglB family)
MDVTRQEAPRDLAESAFTPILRRLWDQLPSLLAAAFADVEGECIDYISRIDPFEAKVSAAHLHMLLGSIGASFVKLGAGETLGFEIEASRRTSYVRRVGGEYLLVVVVEAGQAAIEPEDAIAMACAEFRHEVGLGPLPWDSVQRRLSVRVRPATGWTYAPQGYSDGGVRVTITDVIGRWTEQGGVRGDELVCFRVRIEDGREVTLVHDPDGNGWVVRD